MNCDICKKSFLKNKLYKYQLDELTLICKDCLKLIPQYLLLDEKLSHSKYLKVSIDILNGLEGSHDIDLNKDIYATWLGIDGQYYYTKHSHIVEVENLIYHRNYTNLKYIIHDGLFKSFKVNITLTIEDM